MTAVLASGAAVGDHVLEERLGEGGFGEVWRARRRAGAPPPPEAPDEPEQVALKIARDPGKARSLAREARLLADLRHEGIVRTYRVRLDENPPHLVLALIAGEDLRRTLDARDGRRVARPEALAIACRIAEALGAAHDRGIDHGDVKPANVLIERGNGSIHRVVLTDFGLGRAQDGGGPAGASASLAPSLSVEAAAPSLAGTLAYLAPEVRRGGHASAASDVYALGVVLYEMLAGHPLRGRLKPLADLGLEAWPALDDLLARLLHPDPERRPRDGDEVAREIARLESGARAADFPRRCPEDGAPLHVATVEGCEVDRCRTCGGTWFDTGELQAVIREMARSPRPLALADDLVLPAGRCPVCANAMTGSVLRLFRSVDAEETPAELGTVGRCAKDGIWLPAAAREALLRAVRREAAPIAPVASAQPAPHEPEPESSAASSKSELFRAVVEAARNAPGLWTRTIGSGELALGCDSLRAAETAWDAIRHGAMAWPALSVNLGFIACGFLVIVLEQYEHGLAVGLLLLALVAAIPAWTVVGKLLAPWFTHQLIISMNGPAVFWGIWQRPVVELASVRLSTAPLWLEPKRSRIRFTLEWRDGHADLIDTLAAYYATELVPRRRKARAFAEALAAFAGPHVRVLDELVTDPVRRREQEE